MRAAADEIERLRVWKAEATAVINAWERVFRIVPEWFRLGRLGETKSETTLAYVKTLLDGEA